jgi:gas vesicle protein GvpA/GvpJ/GvpM family
MAKSRGRLTSTIPSERPPQQPRRPPAPKPTRRGSAPPASTVARIIDSDTSLLDVLDNLLNQGVVLNADLILALANVDLVFIRLAALVCAADRLLPAHDSNFRSQ